MSKWRAKQCKRAKTMGSGPITLFRHSNTDDPDSGVIICTDTSITRKTQKYKALKRVGFSRWRDDPNAYLTASLTNFGRSNASAKAVQAYLSKNKVDAQIVELTHLSFYPTITIDLARVRDGKDSFAATIQRSDEIDDETQERLVAARFTLDEDYGDYFIHLRQMGRANLSIEGIEKYLYKYGIAPSISNHTWESLYEDNENSEDNTEQEEVNENNESRNDLDFGDSTNDQPKFDQDAPLLAFSGQHHDEDKVQRISPQALASDISDQTEKIIIITGYATPQFLRPFIKRVGKSTQIHIHIDSSEFSRNRPLQDYLYKIKNQDNIQISLHASTGIFHTKLYGFISKNSSSFWIGSANATGSGFSRNEELLIRLTTNTTSIKSYIKNIESSGTELSDHTETPTNSIEQIFYDGTLYMEREWQSKFTLPIEFGESSMLTNIQLNPSVKYPPGLEIKSTAGFNLISALELNQKVDRSSFKSYMIRTCYGLWAPREFDDVIQEISKNKGSSRNKFLSKVAEKSKAKRDDVFSRYKEILTILVPDWTQKEAIKVQFESSFEKFWSRLFDENNSRGCLLSQKNIRTLSAPLIRGQIPPIFDTD